MISDIKKITKMNYENILLIKAQNIRLIYYKLEVTF